MTINYNTLEQIVIDAENFDPSLEASLSYGEKVIPEEDKDDGVFTFDNGFFVVDDGINCNVLGIKGGKFYWVDTRSGEFYKVGQKLVDEILKEYSSSAE